MQAIKALKEEVEALDKRLQKVKVPKLNDLLPIGNAQEKSNTLLNEEGKSNLP